MHFRCRPTFQKSSNISIVLDPENSPNVTNVALVLVLVDS